MVQCGIARRAASFLLDPARRTKQSLIAEK
jgi:hypothetical protein